MLNKKLIMSALSLCALTACGGEGTDLISTIAPQTTASSTPAPTATVPAIVSAVPVVLAAALDPNQVSIVSASASDVYVLSGATYVLSFVLSDPLNSSKCTITRTTPPQALLPAGAAEAPVTQINGPCTSYTHNQSNSLNNNFTLYVNNGATIATYSWTVRYASSAVAYTASVVPVTPVGTIRVVGSQVFSVTPTDQSGSGTCTWKLDGSTVSTSCRSYSYTQSDSATHALVYTLTNSNNSATASWTVKPGATLTGLTPASAAVSSGASQTFVATVSDPRSSGYLCEFKLDGALAQTRGSCSYTFTRSDSLVHAVAVDVVYDAAGTSKNGLPATAYANPPTLHAVSINGVNQPVGKVYFPAGADTTNFGVTSYTDVDSAAWFTWTLNGVSVNCGVTTTACTWTNASLKNGMFLPNYNGGQAVLVVTLTNGQYSDSRTWIIDVDTATINANQGGGTYCYKSGTRLTIFGNGFEASDTFTIQNQNITLTPVQVSYWTATLELPAGVSPGSQAIRVVKGAHQNQTGATFVTFTNSLSYCPN